MPPARVSRARRGTRAEPPPVEWGEYAAAVHRWELITGRPAPYPTQPGRHGRPVLAPAFVEWLMGLPPGWATADHLDLPRTAQLRALGNGVMPQQAAHALRLLLADLTHLNHPPAGVPLPVPARPRGTARPSTGTSRPADAARARRAGTGARP
ncbi:DNA-cytosine methyltransferase [Amycolatopsis camponoti]|uniref:DNA-cytosine methyltransferase n=1 Tax=Amycolatopsis camponoti TaxID=2606593 RepID=A0A6I8LWX0_9PSEU|nr:DNA-cytosine methyltransferase [Amycolatopsis camponoti]